LDDINTKFTNVVNKRFYYCSHSGSILQWCTMH